jgi:chemosensory pili system protein ChpA (sensor histidine kinase/response regulator)
MADKRNFTALDWVAGEIGETLNEAGGALEAYVSNTDDVPRLRFCLNHLHQVLNILQMVELHGGALLAEEMEKLTQALVDKKIANTKDAHEVLMRAILQLPVYLERVKNFRSDDPASLISLLNDLRAIRGENLFTESQLFAPDMRAARQASGPRVRFDDEKFHDVMKKLRHMYEAVMVNIMRDRNYDAQLPALRKVFENFRKVCQGTVRSALWDVGLALVEGIESDVISGSVTLNSLLRDMDKEIRHMATAGVTTLDEPASEELLKNLLYYIARSQGTTPEILSIRQRYRLDNSLPGLSSSDADGAFGAIDPEAMRSVVLALNEEFQRAKEIFNSYVSGEENSNEALAPAVVVFKQAGDTLAMLGLTEQRKKVESIIRDLQARIGSGTKASADALLDMASRLVEVEINLNARFNSGAQAAVDGAPLNMQSAVVSAHDTVLHECSNGLEQIKEAIVDYIGSQWDGAHLQALPELLQSVRGGLEIVGQRRAARILGACDRYIREKLIGSQNKPEFSAMDALADAIASIEYYLECLDEDVIEEQDETLAVAESSVATLGYAVAVYHRAPQAYLDEAPVIEPLDTEAPVEVPMLAETIVTEVDAAESELTQEMMEGSVESAVEANIPMLETVELLTEEPVPVVAAPVVTASAAASVAAASVAAPVGDASVKPESIDAPLVIEDYDEEIAEIFIEEAGEVLEAIHEYYPKWREDFSDNASLTEFRRAFHTLKGSGRMAKAIELGELSWSVENMLNRIIDGTIQPSKDLCTVIDAVVEKIPSMIEAFSQLKVDPQPALSERLSKAASAIANGQPLPSLAAPDVSDAVPVLESAAEEIVVDEIAPAEEFFAAEDALVVDELTAEEVEWPALPDVQEIQQAPVAAAFEEAVVEMSVPEEMADISTAEPDIGFKPVVEMEDMDADFDPVLWEIFASEAETHLQVADEWLAYARERAPLPVETSDPLQRALHTLKGSAHMAEVTPIAELATPFEKLVKELRAYQIAVGEEFSSLLSEVVDEIRYGLQLIDQHKKVVLPHCASLLARTDALRAVLTGGGEVDATAKPEAPISATVDPTRFNNFLLTDMDALMDVAPRLAQWRAQQDHSGLDRILFELAEMAAGADEAGLTPIASLARAIAPAYTHAIQSNGAFAAWETLAVEAHNHLIDFMDRLAASEDLAQDTAMEDSLAQFCATEFVDTEVVAAEYVEASVEDVVAETSAEEELVVDAAIAEPASTATDDTAVLAELDADLLDIFLEEADEILEQLDEEIHQWSEDPQTSMADAVRRSLHTFKGGARMCGLMLLGTWAHDLETQLEFFTGDADASLFALLNECQDRLFRGVAMVRAWRNGETATVNFAALAGDAEPAFVSAPVIDEHVVASAEENIEEIVIEPIAIDEVLPVEEASTIEASVPEISVVEEVAIDTKEPVAIAGADILEYSDDIDEELLGIFLEEADELTEELEQLIGDWQAAPEDSSFADALRRNLHTLKGGARMAGLTGLGSLAHDLETQLETFSGAADHALFAQILQCQDAILTGVKQGRMLAAGERPQAAVVPLVAPVPAPVVEEPVVAAVVEEEPIAQEIIEEVAASAIEVMDLGISEDADPEMFALFLEEASELVEDLETQIDAWRNAPEDKSFCDSLKRILHTFKGGARMTGIMALGELAHDLETQLEQFSGVADDALFATINDYYEKMLKGVAQVKRIVAGESVAIAPVAPVVAEKTAVSPQPAAKKPTDTPAPQSATIIPFRGGQLPRGLEDAIAGRKATHAAVDAKAAQAQQEMVKVSADLLENLVNLAGETSISRARVEQQMIDIERTAEEMDATITRLQDQLRRLEAETDAQIQSRMTEIQERSDDFDPLEMDRYSTVQQLTSSLTESASDLLDIRSSLTNKLRDTETLLVQQARINTGLQEGLMRSRMVPFSRLEPRLRRIVRQVAGELKKDIAFDLENVQGELDRTMLERMVAPLEHMLRNACDHGVETPEKRLAAGKSKQGRIVLSLGRDGGDILISLRDDGGGINVDAVRKKAIERGLLTPDSPITDNEALQFILQAGFSTAEKVTQISGRGVGMDVVHSEIKSMGGSMTIQSAVGKGTEFIVRLPFTVSVNRALMVRVGEDTFAIPLTSIEGLVRVSPYELESYYEDPTARFEYVGRQYEVRYLGAMLRTKMHANVETSTLPEPVILVRSAEHTVALHVDQLIGSREIVVKALGPQFAAVPGLSGATLLGDGSVVVILDLLALVRANLAHEGASTSSAQSVAPTMEENITVMVCDDSVTVRKVTSRLLEREGFNVMLAKDGADALLQMQDRLPDVLLLDIEMPRMDGFEVASTMKNSHRMQDIPIIMITSRTGEKHRERAVAMGVERYMGKPYVEEELLLNINDLVGERLANRMARYERDGS